MTTYTQLHRRRLPEDHITFLIEAGLLLDISQGCLSWEWSVDHEAVTCDHDVLWPGDQKQMNRVGQMLLDENQKSVNYLHNETGERLTYSYQPAKKEIDPERALVAAVSYEQKSSAHPAWRESEACAYINALKRRALRCLADKVGSRGEARASIWSL